MLPFVFLSALASGFVDAIAGGGGLIMIPALLATGLPVHAAIATNKLCSTSGALTSAFKFTRTKNVHWRSCLFMGLPAVVGSYIGSRSLTYLPKEWAEPLVITLLIGITAFVLFKPQFGVKAADEAAQAVRHTRAQMLKLGFLGAAVGFHDGFFGPGTGTFLVFGLISLGSLDFLKGTGTAKVINLMTNVTALGTFLMGDAIDFTKGFTGMAGMIIGSYCGAHLASVKGSRIIRPVFATVTLVLVAKLMFDYFGK